MIINALIFLSETTKLGLLYLAYHYKLNSVLTLVFCWLIWELASAIILGKFSDTRGRRVMLLITVTSSVIVSLFGRSQDWFIPSLLLDGMLASATLPIAFAAKNDQNPTVSKRITYAEAYQFRALPWIIIPLFYLLLGYPERFWDYVLLLSSLVSLFLVFFLKDSRDIDVNNGKPVSGAKLTSLILLFLFSFLVAETAYQTSTYIVEESEDLVSITKSYMLFGLGLFLTSTIHTFKVNFRNVSLSDLCSIVFVCTAFYFFIKFISFSWEDQNSLLSYTEKTILGASSGLYIPLIYALVCDKFKIHQQGFLCGLLEATTTVAEIISPVIAFLFIKLNINQNFVFLFIGFGFYLSYSIIKGNRIFYANLLRIFLRIK